MKGYHAMFIGDGDKKPMPFMGDPARVAKAILAMADMEGLPLRVQPGSDSAAVVRFNAKQTIKESKKLDSFSCSTNADGFDPDRYMKAMLSTWS